MQGHGGLRLQRGAAAVAALGQLQVVEHDAVLVAVEAVAAGEVAHGDGAGGGPGDFVHAQGDVDAQRQHQLFQGLHRLVGLGLRRRPRRGDDARGVHFAQREFALQQRRQAPADARVLHFHHEGGAAPAQPADLPARAHGAGDVARFQGLAGGQVAGGLGERGGQGVAGARPPPGRGEQHEQQRDEAGEGPERDAQGAPPARAGGRGRGGGVGVRGLVGGHRIADKSGRSRSEAEAQAQVQPQGLGLHAVGDVGLQRAHGAAPAQAGAHAHARIEVAPAIGHGAGIHEHGALEVGAVAAQGDGALPFHAAHGEVAAAVEGVVLGARADLAVAVAAHGGVAAREEQLGDRDVRALAGDHRAALGAQREAAGAHDALAHVHAAQGQEGLPAHARAHERIALGPQRGAHAQFGREAVAAGGRGVVVEVAARPAVVGADGVAGGRRRRAAALGVVVLQEVAAVDVPGAFRAAAAQAHAVGVVAAGFLALHLRTAEPAPAALFGQGRPFGGQQARFLVDGDLAHGAPADAGQAVVDVVHAQARTGVGGDADAEHHLLQRRLAHLRGDGRGLRIGTVGVEGEEHRVVVAAAGQACLRVQQFLLGVVRARGQARDAARAVGVVAVRALHAQRAEAVGRARGVGHAQPGLAAVGVDLGAAGVDARRGVAADLQLAQAVGLGAVPGVLREGLAGLQRPGALDALPAAREARRFGLGAGEGDVGRGDLGARAGLHVHGDGPGRGAAGRLLERDGERGAEVAHGAQQLAGIGVGRAEQAREFAGLQVGQLAEALQLHVPLEQFAHGVGASHVEREGICAAGGFPGIGGDGGGVVVAVRLVAGAGQQAAALERHETQKQQRRPTGRRCSQAGHEVYFDSSRMVSSSPLRDKGYIRPPSNCRMRPILCRYCQTPCGSGLIQACFGKAWVSRCSHSAPGSSLWYSTLPPGCTIS